MRPVGSKYLLEEPLGRGATGTVWRARQRETAGAEAAVAGQPGETVAIKVLKEELANDADVVMRFLRERSVLLRLTHPNIVRTRDLVVEGDLLALVMDLIDGPDLHRYLRENGPLTPVAASLLTAQIADPLAASPAARVVHRAPVSLLIAFAATALVVVTGTAARSPAGYFGGRVAPVLSRPMDLTMSFPSLIFMIAMMSVAQDVHRVVLMAVVIGVFGWPGMARVVRAEALSLRHREFVEAARACGSGPWRILTRQVLPNISGPVIAYTTLLIPGMISTEAALSFLGVGVRPPTPSWGQMIAEAVAYYETDPLYFVVPSVFLFVAVLAFTVLGDALRDILDPQGGRP